MPALTIREMMAAEQSALAAGWTERRLLEEAGTALGHAIARMFPTPDTAVGFLGKGHNAGDVLVALRVLRDGYGWRVFTRHAFPPEELTPLTRETNLALAAEPFTTPAAGTGLLLIDGLLGTGTNGPLRGNLAELTAEMNALRLHHRAVVASVDAPSGVHPDTGMAHPGSVIADVTLMIGNAKHGLLSGNAANFTGRLALVEVPCLKSSAATPLDLICPQTTPLTIHPRPFDFHKGMAGRLSIIAGSQAYPGAAILTAIGALHAGAGLITLHVPENARGLIASRLPPEIMLRPLASPEEILSFPHDALVIGPGLEEPETDVLRLICGAEKPAVLDAEALNLIARSGSLEILRPHHIITPHPGEFRRLFPESAGLSREDAARTFVCRHPAVLLLKGARTIVARQNEVALWLNSTGTPAMSTGGQGDLLSGAIGAFLAGGMSPFDAARFSAWLCGHAAELAAARSGGLTAPPSEIARFLGHAHASWRARSR